MVHTPSASSPDAELPLGVFDSGVGGLSVLRQIRTALPHEDVVYVADSGHCPYGSKTRNEIASRAVAISRFLVEQRCKAVVVACNTASVAALDLLRSSFPKLPIVGMEPGVKPAIAATRTGVVGVLATGATLAGERFTQLVERFGGGVEVVTQPCPGWVELVEHGQFDGAPTRDLVARYVEPLLARGADTLVLGCTHYPFLAATVAQVAGPAVTLIDTGPAVARQTARVLYERNLCATRTRPGVERFYTTGEVAGVQPVVERLWDGPVVLSHLGV